MRWAPPAERLSRLHSNINFSGFPLPPYIHTVYSLSPISEQNEAFELALVFRFSSRLFNLASESISGDPACRAGRRDALKNDRAFLHIFRGAGDGPNLFRRALSVFLALVGCSPSRRLTPFEPKLTVRGKLRACWANHASIR